ncbi:MAG: tRNA guanosine(34) transglycosylase Tgt [Planctomycetes bacterium]|nr:tRNA guanosine(34) transglycosylase Tgt [Planctomycetota bacterium]
MFAFDLEATDPHSRARLGRLTTPHGPVPTPAFMPIGTAGAVKGITPAQLADTGARMILANTYHLNLRPGPEIIADLGGLHGFMGWDGPILTDSGGYQVFSLAQLNRITDQGVVFRSHLDGATVQLDPERVMHIQQQLGADIIMAFDQCPPLPSPREEVEAAAERTVRWARRCRDAHQRPDQWLFGIVQGGLDIELRQSCAERLIDIGFDGYAVGGLSVGERHPEMIEALAAVTPLLPPAQPRYLMGVGMPRDIFEAVRTGIDLFDCVLPTRNGRNAYAFVPGGNLRLRNSVYRTAEEPLEAGCPCYTCRHFSRAYLRHLFLAGEMLGPILTTIHNLSFYQRLMSRIRELIPTGKLGTIRDEFPVVRAQPEPAAD